MQNKVVLDSCVFNKLFLQEPDTHVAIELITFLIENNFSVIVPTLFFYEVLSIAQLNNYPAEQIYELITHFEGIQFTELDKECIKKAFEICKSGHVKSGFPAFYDASYHALAVLNDCHFITADKRHFVKTSQLGNIILLSDWENSLNG